MTREEYEKQKKSLEEDLKELEMQNYSYTLAILKYQDLILKDRKNINTNLRDFMHKKKHILSQRYIAIKELLIKIHEEYIASLEKGEA